MEATPRGLGRISAAGQDELFANSREVFLAVHQCPRHTGLDCQVLSVERKAGFHLGLPLVALLPSGPGAVPPTLYCGSSSARDDQGVIQ
jgi:hypothetical protein